MIFDSYRTFLSSSSLIAFAWLTSGRKSAKPSFTAVLSPDSKSKEVLVMIESLNITQRLWKKENT